MASATKLSQLRLNGGNPEIVPEKAGSPVSGLLARNDKLEGGGLLTRGSLCVMQGFKSAIMNGISQRRNIVN
jgi:hypothetical protein